MRVHSSHGNELTGSIAVDEQSRGGFGDVLRTARVAARMSQSELAAALSYSRNAVHRWEHSARQPSDYTVTHVMEFFRRPHIRAEIHKQPIIEKFLVGAGLLQPLNYQLEEFQVQALMLAGWDELSEPNQAALDRLFVEARQILAQRA